MSTKKQILIIVSGMAVFTFWVVYEHKTVYAYHNFYARSASDLAVGTLPDARLSTSVFVLNLTTPAHLGGFTTSGTIIAAKFVGTIDASSITAGTLPDARLSTSVFVTNSSTYAHLGGLSTLGSVTIGTGSSAGFGTLEVRKNLYVMGSTIPQARVGSIDSLFSEGGIAAQFILWSNDTSRVQINASSGTNSYFNAQGAKYGFGTTSPSSALDVTAGSITSKGNNAGLAVQSGSITVTDMSANTFTINQTTAAGGGANISTGSFVLINSSGAALNGVKYGFPTAACSDGQIWKANGNTGNWGCAADATGGGGGGVTTESTITIKLTANGDVATSSAVFEAIPGAVFSTHFASMSILGWELFCTGVSTVSATKVRIAFSTSTDAGTPFTYISTETTIDTNLKWNTYTSSAAKTLNYRESIALHISSSAYTGTPMRGLSLLIRARKGLDNQP